MASRKLHSLVVSTLILALGLAGCSPAAPVTNAPTVTTLAGLETLAVPPGLTGTATLAVMLGGTLQVAEIDMASGAVRLLAESPPNAWLSGLAVSPQDGTPLLAYAPPPEGPIQTGLSGLYTVVAGEFVAWVERDPAVIESYLHPAWAADGHTLYYTHYEVLPDAPGGYRFQVEQRTAATATPGVVATAAGAPSPSPDGEWLALLSYTSNLDENALLLARADGRDLRPLLPAAEYPIVDAPVFSADSQWVYISLPEPETASRAPANWWDALLGVRVARAHNLPASWWRVPVAGGAPERLTTQTFTQLDGAVAPDGEWLLSASDQGLFVLHLASGEVTFLLRGSVMFYGLVAWRP